LPLKVGDLKEMSLLVLAKNVDKKVRKKIFGRNKPFR
jgi:hypothetical protein